jgi:hypothetical protein
MKRKILCSAVFAAIACGSCKVVGTLYPLSENEGNFLYKKQLIGKWRDIKDSSGFYNIDTIAGTGGKLYRAEIVSNEKEKKSAADTALFLVSIIKLSDWFFLDCQLDIKSSFSAKGKDYNDLLVAKHFLCRLNFVDPDKIEIAFPDPEELIKLIDQKKIRLDYYLLKKDDYLILNKSKELQVALTESKKYPGLYKEKNILMRLR